ncbi:MFS transporter [Bryocella elongata]|uniref:MFS transporter n=1 Tax=Bryocella elongata TaxID=863522 RepID=UPI0013590361|nr:hypothetical protein [Bryocella elongata]
MPNHRPTEGLNYVLFAATAFGVVLPGTVLPQLLARWSFNDRQAGILLFLSFVSSSVGAVIARGKLPRAVSLGFLAMGIGLFGLRVASASGAFAAITLMGGGMGAAMTAISLMQSRQHAATRSAELSRLNLIWSVGACFAPSILLRGGAHWGLNAMLVASGVVFTIFATAATLVLQEVNASAPVIQTDLATDVALAPVRSTESHARLVRQAAWTGIALLVVIPMSTGVESSLGGWLTTYSRRSGLASNGTLDTITCLWLGLLLGRLVHSFPRVAALGEKRVLATAPALLSAAIGAILVVHTGWSMSLSALVAGFALGPVYPLALAMWLEHGERGNLAFLVAGCGSSALPLLTGIVSNATHSLTRGLYVSLAGGCVMLLGAAATALLAPPRNLSPG